MNTNVTVSNCTNCSSPLTAADLMGTACRYCGAALPHQVAAAQQVAVVNQLIAGPNSPYQAMAHQAMAQAYGAPPAGPYGAPPPGPYGMHPAMIPGMQMAQAQIASARRTVIIVSVVIAAVVGVITIGAVLAVLIF